MSTYKNGKKGIFLQKNEVKIEKLSNPGVEIYLK